MKDNVPIECGHWHHVVPFLVEVDFPCDNSLLREKRLKENDHVEIDGFVGSTSIACACFVHDLAGDAVRGWGQGGLSMLGSHLRFPLTRFRCRILCSDWVLLRRS